MATKAASKQRNTLTTKKAAHGKQASKEKSKGEVLTKLESTGIIPDERSQMIAEAAYYRAEQRGFDPEGQEQDWLEAESDVDAMLSISAQQSSDVSH